MDFYDIALAKFLQSFPELSNYIVTFQDLTQQLSNAEESEVSVGAFIIKAGTAFFYIPVIAKGANLYPIDSMFSVEKEKFLPLTPKTVVTIINSQSFTLGDQTKIPANVPRNPSVYDLVNPPRTGKYVYASASRLTEFLSVIPDDIKKYVKERIVDNKKLYQGMNDMFGLKEILDPLSKLNPAPTTAAPAITQHTQPVKVITEGHGLSEDEIRQILSAGYAIRGTSETNRIAITAEDSNRISKMSQAGLLESNREYTLVLSDGSTKEGFVPKLNSAAISGLKRAYDCISSPPGVMPQSNRGLNFTIYEDGNFSKIDNAVVQGSAKEPSDVLTTLFNYRPPVMLKNLEGRETFALLTPEMELVGVFSSHLPPSRTGEGVVVKSITDLLNGGTVNLFGYHNLHTYTRDGSELYVPYDVLVVLLSKDISYDLEVNVNAASKKRSMAELITLGNAMSIGYDGVEFSINGSPIGGEPKLVEILVSKEGIDPSAATSFIKQAKERKSLKIYLSKKADFAPGEIPQFGEQAPQANPNDQLVQGSRDKQLQNLEPNLEQSMAIGDPQTTEATVLAELLQAPDMYQYIEEYTPDIEEALDKLGRILFLLRINLDKFGQGSNPSEVFSFISQLRNVYRMLGDNFIKLQQLLANSNVSTET